MEQIKENKVEILETIKKYGKMPVNPERAAFLANCWAAYNALCLLCGEKELGITDHEVDAYGDFGAVPLTKDQVMCWVASMENADGKQGGRWSMEQTEQVRVQRNIDCDPVKFYA